jgi:Tfp pilus assembly protein PilF
MNKRKILGILSIVLMVGVAVLPTIAIAYRVIIIALILGLDFYSNRALLYFMQGNKNIMSKKGDPQQNQNKAWESYRKAYNTGKLDAKYLVTMGNVLAQRGDPSFSMKVLDSVIDNPNAEKALRNQAKVQKSMALERIDKLDEAIAILQEAREDGFKEKSLYINLACYLLFDDKMDEAESVLDEGIDLEKTSAGALDNRGWLYIAQNRWTEASEVYSEMMDRKPTFPDPYIHCAQVKLHYGKVDEALSLFKTSIDKKWNEASFFNKETIEDIITNLEKDDKELYVAKANASFVEIAKGLSIKNISDDDAAKLIPEEFEQEPKSSFTVENNDDEESEENSEEISYESDEEETFDNDIDESDLNDDELPNTDLTDADLEWEKEHNQ